tara:strand:- start:139 stop:450 length:312 start_codon:yes stop_codon:yes gene_type:complete
MTKKTEQFISKLEMHIISRMHKGEKMYEHIESDKSTFIVGEEKRATRIRTSLVKNLKESGIIRVDNKEYYNKGNVFYLGFKSKNRKKMVLTPIGKQIAEEFTI